MAFEFLHSRHDEAPISIPAMGLDLFVRVPPSSTGGVLTVIETINAPGFGPPRHRHRETEIFRVMEGRYLFEVDGRQFVADAGDVVTVPGEAVHGFVNITDQPARQFITIVPGLDAATFFLGLAELMGQGLPDGMALNRFGQEWNMEFLGPPLAKP
jgi:quercetin dioxygenase-like cupin family protein